MVDALLKELLGWQDFVDQIWVTFLGRFVVNVL